MINFNPQLANDTKKSLIAVIARAIIALAVLTFGRAIYYSIFFSYYYDYGFSIGSLFWALFWLVNLGFGISFSVRTLRLARLMNANGVPGMQLTRAAAILGIISAAIPHPALIVICVALGGIAISQIKPNYYSQNTPYGAAQYPQPGQLPPFHQNRPGANMPYPTYQQQPQQNPTYGQPTPTYPAPNQQGYPQNAPAYGNAPQQNGQIPVAPMQPQSPQQQVPFQAVNNNQTSPVISSTPQLELEPTPFPTVEKHPDVPELRLDTPDFNTPSQDTPADN